MSGTGVPSITPGVILYITMQQNVDEFGSLLLRAVLIEQRLSKSFFFFQEKQEKQEKQVIFWKASHSNVWQ